MSITDIAFLLVKDVFLYMIIGAVLARLNLYTPRVIQFLLKRVVVAVLLPLLIFEKVIANLTIDDLGNVLTCFLFPVVMVFFSSFLFQGLVLPRLSSINNDQKPSVLLANTFHNYGFIVYPLSLALYGPRGLSLAFIFALTCDAIFWSYGVYIMQKEASKVKEIFNPPFVTVLLSIILAFSGFKQVLPGALLEYLGLFNMVTIPLALTTVGAVFFHSFHGVNLGALPRKPLLVSMVSRTLFFPVFFLLVSLLVLPPSLARDIVFIEVIMPASIGVVVLVVLYNGYHAFVVSFSVISNLLAVLSIPLYLFLIEFLKGY